MNFDNFGSFGIMNDYDCMDEPSFFKWSLIFKVMLDQRSVLSSFLGFLLGCPNSKLLVVLESSMVTDVQIDVFFQVVTFFFKLCLTNGQFWANFFSLSKFDNFHSFGIVSGHWYVYWCFYFKWSLFFKIMLDQLSVLSHFF